MAGTFTMSASGFAALPVTAPAGWPANLAWPANASPNGTKSWTVSDADWIAIMTWTANQQNGNLPQLPATMTITQLLLGFVGIFVNGVKAAVQQFLTVPAAPPPPPTFT
jgi:hypothetical protein